MQTAIKRYLYLLGVFALGYLFSLLSPRLGHRETMETINSSFTIEVNGEPIAVVEDNDETSVQAKIGAKAAVFTLKNGRLQSDGWALGRAMREDRSFLPKPVLWFKLSDNVDKLVKPVTALQNGSSYELKFADAGLVTTDGNVFANLQGGDQSNVIVKIEESE